MAEVRVRLPLGALHQQDVGKPGIPRASGARDRRFKSGRPDCDCGGACVGTGRRLLSVTSQVRFLPPQLYGRASQLAMGRPESGRAMSLEGSTPSLSACTCPWPIGRGTRLPTWTGGFDSRRALWFVRGWANGTLPGFEPGDEGSIPSPRASTLGRTYRGQSCHRQLLRGRLTAGWDALNVSVLVRFQPPQLAAAKETEVIRLDEEPVLRTGAALSLWVRVPRLPPATHVPGVMAARLAPTQLVRVQVLGGVPWANVRP
jgi:hypothetical protein